MVIVTNSRGTPTVTPQGPQRPPILPYQQPGQPVQLVGRAAQIEKRLEPSAQPQQAMVNSKEEIVPAPVVEALGGSAGVTAALNQALVGRGKPPLSGDKGTVGDYAGQRPSPAPAAPPVASRPQFQPPTMQGMANMARGTVGRQKMPNFAAGTVGTTNATPPPVPSATDPVPATAAGVAQGATNVQTTASNKAVAGFQSPTLTATSNATQNLLQGPATNKNYVPRALEGYDVNAAKAFEAYRQKTAPVSNTAGNRDELMNYALSGAIDRSQLENQLTQEQETTDWNRRLQALAEGRATTGVEQGAWAGDIDALTQVRQGAEGEATRTWQTAENTVARDWEMGKLVSIQDFDREMKQIDTDLAKALQEGDTAAQMALLDKQAYYTQQRDAVQQKWQTAERVATQGWQTGERLSEQDFTAGQAYLDRQQELAIQNNDIMAQRYIEQQKTRLALTLQMNDMNHDEKMTYLDAQIAEAKAAKDDVRERGLMSYAATIDARKVLQEQGFVAAQADLDRKLKEAMQVNDFKQARAIQQTQLAFEREKLAQDKVVSDAELAFREKGLDFQKIQSTYDMIQGQIDAGNADPSAARMYLNSALKEAGVTLTAPDPMATQTALDRDYLMSQFQWSQSHPGTAEFDANGQFTGLSDAGAGEFTGWYNDNIYGNPNIDKYMSGEMPVQGIVGDPTSADYQALLLRATPWDSKSSPSKGQYINVNGTLFYVTTDLQAGGTNGASVGVMNVANGKTGSLNPYNMTNGRYTDWTFSPGLNDVNTQ